MFSDFALTNVNSVCVCVSVYLLMAEYTSSGYQIMFLNTLSLVKVGNYFEQ